MGIDREALEAFLRLNDLMGEHVPEKAQTESARADWQKVYDSLTARAQQGGEAVAEIRKNEMGQVFLCNPDGTAFRPSDHVGAIFYTHPAAQEPA